MTKDKRDMEHAANGFSVFRSYWLHDDDKGDDHGASDGEAEEESDDGEDDVVWGVGDAETEGDETGDGGEESVLPTISVKKMKSSSSFRLMDIPVMSKASQEERVWAAFPTRAQ